MEEHSVRAQGVQTVPADIELQAARLHELLAPSLLRLLENKLDNWAQRQEQFPFAAWDESMNNSKPKQDLSVSIACASHGPCEVIGDREGIDEKKQTDERKDIDERKDRNKWTEMDESKDGNSRKDSMESDMVWPFSDSPCTVDDNEIQSVMDREDSPTLTDYRTNVQNGFSRFKSDLARPWRHGSSCRTVAKGIVDSKSFNFLCGVVMLCHGALMASSANLAMQDAIDGTIHDSSDMMRQVNIIFGSFYTVELALRLLGEGRTFFTNRDYAWNLFDVLMVAVAIEEIFQAVLIMAGSGGTETGNVVFMRLFRLLKLLKALRFVRLLRSFRELRLMIGSIFGCVRSMFWAMVLLSLITFLFGLFFVQACVVEMAVPSSKSSIDSQSRDAIVQYWASVQVAMNSLFLAGTGGDSWRYMAEPLLTVSPLVYGGFLIYIVFFLFVIANTLTSLFIDSYIDSSAKDDTMLIQAQKDKRREIIERAVKISREVDKDESGIIDASEFDAVCNNPELTALMDSLAVDPGNVREFFDMVSQGGQRPVTIAQFVHGCMKIRGPARSVDLVVVIELLHLLEAAHSDFMRYCKAQFDDLNSRFPSSEFCI